MFLTFYGLKAVLMNTARWMKGQGEPADQGAGQVDLRRAAAARHILVTADPEPAASHTFGLIEHQGERMTVTQKLAVQALGAHGCSACRLGVVWLHRAPGMTAHMSERLLVLAQGAAADFQLSLRINGSKAPDGTYMGLVKAQSETGPLWLPFAVTLKGAIPWVPPRPGPAAAHHLSDRALRADARCTH